ALALAAGLALFAGIGAWGAMRLAGAPADTVPGVRLRLIQAGIEQRYKWDPDARRQVFDSQLDLAAQPAADSAAGPVTHVIWPETAIPFFIEHDARSRQAVGAVTPSGGLTLTGAPRRVAGPDGQPRFYNSLLAIDAGGRVTAAFDKFHLVPFGEYMPLRSWLPVGAIAGYGSEFSAGPGPVTLPLAGLPPVSPLICYEVIFPGAVVDRDNRPQWMLNLTNDAWYGHTAGPHQHFAISRVRAVEEGLPLVRSAQTGISGVVDAHGRVTAELGLGARGVLDAALPVALSESTLYGRAGDGVLVVILLICAALAGLARQRR
ncbi:MAG TPA: apolipoprotein N-acyltransferase, partial [Azospirillum sp.]